LFPVTKNSPHSINWSVAILSALVLNVYGPYRSSAPKWGEGEITATHPYPRHQGRHTLRSTQFEDYVSALQEKNLERFDGIMKIMLHILKHPVPFLTVHVQHLKGIHSSLFILLQHYMCLSNWPSSSVRVVEKTSAPLSHCYAFQICKMLLKYHTMIILMCARVV
jgi:hypothetical protein